MSRVFVSLALAATFLVAANVRADMDMIGSNPGVNASIVDYLKIDFESAPVMYLDFNGIKWEYTLDPTPVSLDLAYLDGYGAFSTDWDYLSITGSGTFIDFLLNGEGVSIPGDNWTWAGDQTFWLVNDGIGTLESLDFWFTGYPGSFTIATFKESAVPEPATLAVFGLGLVGLSLVRTRRKK